MESIIYSFSNSSKQTIKAVCTFEEEGRRHISDWKLLVYLEMSFNFNICDISVLGKKSK